MTAGDGQRPGRARVALFLAALMTTLGLADPLGVIHLPMLFLLKDQLALTPPAVATFEAIILLPVYGGFAFGLLRDRIGWGRWGDRGWFLLAAPVAIGGYLWLATHAPTYGMLLATTLLIMAAFQCMDTSAQAMVAVAARGDRMSGPLSAAAELAEVAPKILAVLGGGWLVLSAPPSTAFLAAAVLTAAVGLQALCAPSPTIAPAREAPAEGLGNSFARLRAQRALRPTLAILFLWNFAPGWATPFLYFLSDDTGVSGGAFALCKAANLACIAATAIVYGVVGGRYPLRRLLAFSVVINAFPGVLFLFVDGASQAVAVSAIVGLATGFGNVAVFDLLLRVCPKHLEGSAMTLGYGAFCAADVTGDLLGAVLYQHAGFEPCVALDILATLAILPLLGRLPATPIDRAQDHDAPLPGPLSTQSA